MPHFRTLFSDSRRWCFCGDCHHWFVYQMQGYGSSCEGIFVNANVQCSFPDYHHLWFCSEGWRHQLLNEICSERGNNGDGLDCSSEIRDQEKDRSWLMSSLHQIFSRRYFLRRSALKLFMIDRSNFFFDFGGTEGRRNAYRAIVRARPLQLSNVYLATQRPEQFLKRTQLMERWARWKISNFEYLMQFNTLAGRSYNDIAQYPVFPWILFNYSSKYLDLADSSSYWDLSKLAGALNPDRLIKFQKRYSSFDDPVVPKFHYGSHYSSTGTVMYYLIRVESFTTLSI